MSKNTPQLLKGFRDFGPDQMAERLLMLDKIRGAFERFGFAPMETPALEYAATLTGKYGAEEKLMYRFADQGGREVALRYDLTVPLARFYEANKNDLPKPFKRYAIGPVWRAENTQAGRFREFYQCDVDIVGSADTAADAEAIAAVAAALADLGVTDSVVRLNNRKIIDGVLEILQVPKDKYVSVLRLLDKLGKLSVKSVQSGLTEAGLAPDQVAKLFGYLEQSGKSAPKLQKTFGKVILESKRLSEGVSELSDLVAVLELMGIQNTVIDLTLARGLDYYTGTVCEVTLSTLPEFGSIAGGGRYDNLIGSIAGGREIVPAVGMSVGIDRMLAALEELDAIAYDVRRDAIVFNFDEKLFETYLTVVGELRRAGISTDFYYRPDDLAKQFRYAEKKKINLGVIIGEEEIKSGEVTIRNLVSRSQARVKAERLIQAVRDSLG